MKGPDHYAEAERLLQRASEAIGESVPEFFVAQAQVHATLALTSATIQAQMGDLNGTWGRTMRGEPPWPSVPTRVVTS